MKMTKKKVFVVALAVCLIAIISMGTLAWFTASDDIVNDFYVSTDDETQRPDFKLSLFEHKVLADGTLGNDLVKENTYTNILPGDSLKKDPTVKNDGQYDMWVRMSVTLSNYAEWADIFEDDEYDFSAILSGISAEWTLDQDSVGTATLVFYKNTKLAPGESSTLFTGVEIPGEEFTVENIPASFKLIIVADAIQVKNTGATAQEAFENYWG